VTIRIFGSRSRYAQTACSSSTIWSSMALRTSGRVSSTRSRSPVSVTVIAWKFSNMVLDPLDRDGGALADADAQRRDAALPALLLQPVEQSDGDARAGGSQRVAERDGPAPRIDLVVVQAQLAGGGQRLGGEGLVELHRV